MKRRSIIKILSTRTQNFCGTVSFRMFMICVYISLRTYSLLQKKIINSTSKVRPANLYLYTSTARYTKNKLHCTTRAYMTCHLPFNFERKLSHIYVMHQNLSHLKTPVSVIGRLPELKKYQTVRILCVQNNFFCCLRFCSIKLRLCHIEDMSRYAPWNT